MREQESGSRSMKYSPIVSSPRIVGVLDDLLARGNRIATGGPVPYGYHVLNKELLPNKKEQSVIELIFSKFLEERSMVSVALFQKLLFCGECQLADSKVQRSKYLDALIINDFLSEERQLLRTQIQTLETESRQLQSQLIHPFN